MKKLGFPLILCLLLTFFLPLPALAADPIAILPSGDATGQTDAEALQAALSDATPGTVIQLAEGTYYLNHVLLTENFHGTIQGAGREKTVITIVGELWMDTPKTREIIGETLAFLQAQLQVKRE
jgi:hypothetical protein